MKMEPLYRSWLTLDLIDFSWINPTNIIELHELNSFTSTNYLNNYIRQD